MQHQALAPYGWSDRWAALLADHPGCEPARVVRHDGSGLLLATDDGIVAAPLTRRLDPAPTVGDWIACDSTDPVAVLERVSLLTRRAGEGDTSQALAANVDLVLLVCGLDRPVKSGRLARAATLAWDAGATPVVVLTKALRTLETEAAADEVIRALAESSPTLEVLVTSAKEGLGLEPLRAMAVGKTVTMLGESGAGKSSLLNALTGEQSAATGSVRNRDAKGRHTTTTRELYLLPDGGSMIDSPGIRSVGLWVDPDSVDATYDDIDELGTGCKFADCEHDTEPGCVVRAAVEAGSLSAARLVQWRTLRHEAEAAALRALPHEKRKRDKEFARITKDAQKRKNR